MKQLAISNVYGKMQKVVKKTEKEVDIRLQLSFSIRIFSTRCLQLLQRVHHLTSSD